MPYMSPDKAPDARPLRDGSDRRAPGGRATGAARSQGWHRALRGAPCDPPRPASRLQDRAGSRSWSRVFDCQLDPHNQVRHPSSLDDAPVDARAGLAVAGQSYIDASARPVRKLLDHGRVKSDGRRGDRGLVGRAELAGMETDRTDWLAGPIVEPDLAALLYRTRHIGHHLERPSGPAGFEVDPNPLLGVGREGFRPIGIGSPHAR